MYSEPLTRALQRFGALRPLTDWGKALGILLGILAQEADARDDRLSHLTELLHDYRDRITQLEERVAMLASARADDPPSPTV